MVTDILVTIGSGFTDLAVGLLGVFALAIVPIVGMIVWRKGKKEAKASVR